VGADVGRRKLKSLLCYVSACLVTPVGSSRYLKHVPLRVSLVRHAGSVTNDIIHEQFNIPNSRKELNEHVMLENSV